MTSRAAIASGAAVLALVWAGPLAATSSQSFAAHMTAHMAIVAVAAPLLAWGIAHGRHDPVRRVPGFFSAVPASILELVVVWGWHAPELHHAARHSAPMFVAEQGSFLVAGLWLWLSIFGGGASVRADRAGIGVIALALTFAHMTLLGALLSLTPRPLYHAAPGTDAFTLGDQQLGGAIMLATSAVVYVGAGIWLGRTILGRAETVKRA